MSAKFNYNLLRSNFDHYVDDNHRAAELTDSDARQALLDYVSTRYCYGKRPAKEMTILKIENTCAFHVSTKQYKLTHSIYVKQHAIMRKWKYDLDRLWIY